MLKINVICIGKLKEKYWTAAVEEYSKRLQAYCSFSVTELKETRSADKINEAEERRVKDDEGDKILAKVKDGDYVIALDVRGKKLSSEGFADLIESLAGAGTGTIDLIIGGSLGLSESVLTRADYRLSFSDMTFPHQMMRVILAEQVYRSFKIIRGETYHK